MDRLSRQSSGPQRPGMRRKGRGASSTSPTARLRGAARCDGLRALGGGRRRRGAARRRDRASSRGRGGGAPACRGGGRAASCRAHRPDGRDARCMRGSSPIGTICATRWRRRRSAAPTMSGSNVCASTPRSRSGRRATTRSRNSTSPLRLRKAGRTPIGARARDRARSRRSRQDCRAAWRTKRARRSMSNRCWRRRARLTLGRVERGLKRDAAPEPRTGEIRRL